MNNRYKCLRAAITAIVTCLAGYSLADGYRNPPMTAEAQGKSGNALVFTENASAVEYNPANLAFQTNASFVASVTLAKSDTTYSDGITGGKAKLDDPWVPLPNIFFSTPLGDSGFAFGLGITTPYGQGSKFERTELVDPLRPNPVYEAQMTLLNINPSVAFQINDQLSVGGGVDVFVSRLQFKQYYPWSALPSPPFPTLTNGTAEVDAYGYGIGGNIGVTWKITDKQRLALTYRSGFKVDYEGDFEVSNFDASVPFLIPGTSQKSDFSTAIKFPNIIGVGYGIVLADRVRLEANFEWQEWSSNDSLKIDLHNNQPLLNGQNEIRNDWNNSIIAGVGGDWQFADHWVLRAGYRYLETPIPDATLSPILPDTDQHALSVGLGFKTGAHAVDVAYTYSIYKDRNVSAADNPLYPGDYDIDSTLLGLTYSLSF